MELDGIAKKQLAEKGISLEKFETQLNNFQKGFPFSNLQNPATEESGIFTKSEEEIEANNKSNSWCRSIKQCLKSDSEDLGEEIKKGSDSYNACKEFMDPDNLCSEM